MEKPKVTITDIEINPPDVKIDFKNNRVEIEFENAKIHAPLEKLEEILANESKMKHWKNLTKCCFRNKK